LNFASMFGILSTETITHSSDLASLSYFSAPQYPSSFKFLPPHKRSTLVPSQLKKLRIHYRTTYAIQNITDPELMNISDEIEIWSRCELDGTVYSSAMRRPGNSRRLNHLVCTLQGVDTNCWY
jgi:hypothetical protein